MAELKILPYIQKINTLFKQYKLEKSKYGYTLIDVTSDQDSNDFILHVIIPGIKKQILKFKTEEIVLDDELLSKFSPCDVRTITYISFQKYYHYYIQPVLSHLELTNK